MPVLQPAHRACRGARSRRSAVFPDQVAYAHAQATDIEPSSRR